MKWFKKASASVPIAIALMLTVCSSAMPTDLNDYQTALNLLKQGNQAAAEETLRQALQRDRKNQRLAFFMGACARSRWMLDDALPMFYYVSKLNPDSPEGKCAALMLAIDTQEEYEVNFAALETLQKDNPDDPLILWMSAVACRELGRRNAPRVYSEKGAQYYAKLLEVLDPGPVLLHQTYANILSEQLGRHEEALKHREIALRLEPASWSHDGMATTLSYLGRYAEADKHYEKSVEMDPSNPDFLNNWGWSMRRRGCERAFELYQRAAEISPNHPRAWRNLGQCANMLDRKVDAIRFFARAEALERERKQTRSTE